VILRTDCNVSIKQTLGSSWQQEGKTYSQWNVQMTAGSETVKSLELALTGRDFSQFWELTKTSDNRYTLPAYRIQNGGLPAGQVHQFGYIIENASQASIEVASINCGAVTSPSASPSPSPSASPAAPSPSVVATPQPSPTNGCSATVTLVTRSAAAGGVWVDAGATFQIFDLTLTNNGQRALNGGVAAFTLAEAGASITQFWELSRQGSTANAFNVAFNYGALQAGATQGAGIVVRLAGSSPAAKPAVTLGSLGCQ
jgi:hypothetical protein